MANKIREYADRHGIKLVHLARVIGKARNTFTWKLDVDSFTPGERQRLVDEWNSIPRVTVAELFPEDVPSGEVSTAG